MGEHGQSHLFLHSIPYGPPALFAMITKYRARNNP